MGFLFLRRLKINDTVELFHPITTKSARGTPIRTWGDENGEVGGISFEVAGSGIPVGGFAFSTLTLVETIEADVQPKTLNEFDLKQWGVDTSIQDAKVMFYFGESINLIIGNRARVNSATVYDIKATQLWPMHYEVLLIPVQGLG